MGLSRPRPVRPRDRALLRGAASSHQPRGTRASEITLVYRLSNREEVALAVAEEDAAFARAFARVVVFDLHYSIDHLEARYVDLLEDDPASAQVRDHGVYVVDLEPELRRLAGGDSRREVDVELSGRTEVAQTTLTLLDRRKT